MDSETPSTQKTNKGAAVPEHPSSMSHVLSWINTKAPAMAGPLIFSCLCLALAYNNRNRKSGAEETMAAPAPPRSGAKETMAAPRPVLQMPVSMAPRPVLQRSVSMATLHGGKVALQRIMDSQEARIDNTALEDAAKMLQTSLDEKPLNFNKLQRAAAKLEMTGKEDEAVAMLQKAWEKADKEGQTHEAHELQMLLVEMLIYEEKYKEALECKCLNDKAISDARGPLYKTVLNIMMGNRNKAIECYKEFQDIRSRFHWPDALKEGSPLYGVVYDFQSFERIVNNLKREIEDAHKTKQTTDTK